MCTGIVFLASLLPIFLPSLSLSCSGVEVNTYCRCSNNPPSPSLASRRSQPVSRVFPLFPCDSARSDSRSLFPIRASSFPIPYKPFSVSFHSSRIPLLSVYTVTQNFRFNSPFLNEFLVSVFLLFIALFNICCYTMRQ